MSTQYDAIQGPYDAVRHSTICLIEHENIRTAVAPYIANARVLEMACGSGCYTYKFLEWGAAGVLAVDISSVMIDEARRRKPAGVRVSMVGDANGDGDAGKSGDGVSSAAAAAPGGTTTTPATPSETTPLVNFLLADCSTPTAYPGGPYDIVFGAWLLNYAPDRQTLLNMFRNIAVNLRPGGRFVSITVVPDDNPPTYIETETAVRPPPKGSGGLYYQVLNAVPDGVYFHVHGHTEIGDVAFDCYHLRAALHEECAREAGLKGKWTWGVTEVPEGWLEGSWEGGASREELESYTKVPNYGVLVVEK